jgi:hypothetical protein
VHRLGIQARGHNPKVVYEVGAVRKSGVKVGPNHWHKARVQMLSSNGWLVAYLRPRCIANVITGRHACSP